MLIGLRLGLRYRFGVDVTSIVVPIEPVIRAIRFSCAILNAVRAGRLRHGVAGIIIPVMSVFGTVGLRGAELNIIGAC